MWDYESDAPLMWPEQQKYPTRTRRRARSSTATRRRPRSAASGAIPEFLKDVSKLNPEAEGHAVRRLPRPRLELPRGLQARPQGHPARQAGHRSSPTTIRRSSRRRCTSPRSTSTSACTASTATSRRTRTATATSTARSPRRSRSTASTATAPRTRYPTLRTSGPAARPGGMDLSLLRTPGRAPALRVARRQADPALGARPEARVGDDAGEGHRHAGPCRTTTRRPRAPS